MPRASADSHAAPPDGSTTSPSMLSSSARLDGRDASSFPGRRTSVMSSLSDRRVATCDIIATNVRERNTYREGRQGARRALFAQRVP